MKKIITGILLLFISVLPIITPVIIPNNPVYAASKKISLAIIDFDNNSGIEDWEYMKKGVPRILIANLAQNKGIKIVEREKLDKALKELKFSQSGFVDPDTARKLGKIIGADYALYGSITRFGTTRPTIIIDATIMDIQTGEIKFVESVRGNDENAIVNLLDKLSVMLLNDLIPTEVNADSGNNVNVSTNVQPQKTVNNVLPINPVITPPPPSVKPPTQTLNHKDNIIFSGQFDKTASQIYFYDNKGSVIKLTNTPNNNHQPVWSPDGNKVAYVNEKYGVSVLDFVKGTNITFSNKPVFDDYPQWTPDGKKVIFLTKEKGGKYAIYSSDDNGKNLKAVTPVGYDVFYFDISRTGKIVYCAKTGTDTKRNIFTINVDGTQNTKLTTSGDNISPEWSNKGDRIVFSSNKYGEYRIFIMDEYGGKPIQITKDGYGIKHESPLWSPDDSSIAYITIIRGKGRVSLVDTNGNNQKTLVFENDNYDLVWLPDGSELGYTYNGNIAVVNLYGQIRLVNINNSDKNYPKWRPNSY